MVDHVRVKFGTTEDFVKATIRAGCNDRDIDPNQVHYVIDLNVCTVEETAYAYSDKLEELPSHPGGESAIQKLEK